MNSDSGSPVQPSALSLQPLEDARGRRLRQAVLEAIAEAVLDGVNEGDARALAAEAAARDDLPDLEISRRET